MRNLIMFFVIVIATSCASSGEHILTIENNSSSVVDSARIRARQKMVLLASIDPGKSRSERYSIDSVSNYEDAFYAAIYFSDTTIIVPSFGYHANTRSIPNVTLVVDKQLKVREKSD